jgi:hypothetical protein
LLKSGLDLRPGRAGVGIPTPILNPSIKLSLLSLSQRDVTKARVFGHGVPNRFDQLDSVGHAETLGFIDQIRLHTADSTAMALWSSNVFEINGAAWRHWCLEVTW